MGFLTKKRGLREKASFLNPQSSHNILTGCGTVSPKHAPHGLFKEARVGYKRKYGDNR